MNYELMAEIAVTGWLALSLGMLLSKPTHRMNLFLSFPTTAIVAFLLYVGGFFDALTSGPWYATTAVWVWIGLIFMGLGVTTVSHGKVTENSNGATLFSGLLIFGLYIIGGLYH